MNPRNALLAVLLTMIASASGRVLAHHSFTMFEMDKDVTYKGVVVDYKWINPHVHITVDIKGGPGVDPATVGTWDVEGGSTNIMGRQGWTRATLKAGAHDHTRRPSNEGWLEGNLALLHDHARRKADVSRHRAPEG